MNREYLKSRCFEDEDENWWERRSGMERFMFVSLIIVFAIALGCITFITLQYLLREEFCTSTTCMFEALKLESNINMSVDPCDDFIKYSCKELPEEVNLALLVENEINRLVQEPISDMDSESIKKEKSLFLTCMNETDSENSVNVMQEMLNEIGGWPVVVGYRWRARLFEWTEAVYALRSRGFPFSMFFTVNTSESKILISNPTDTNFGYNRDLYRKFMIDTAVAFGADRYQAQLQMEDVLNFAEELGNITKEKKKNKAEELFSSQLTVDELQKIYDEIQWADFLNNILYPAVSVSSSDIVAIPSHEYLGTILDLLSATPRRVQANFLVWKVIEEMIPFMTKELQNLKRNYTCQTGGESKINRADFCTEFLNNIYYARPLHILLQSSVTNFNSEIEEIVGSVKTELLNMLRNSNFDDISVKESIDFISSIEDVIGLPENLYNESISEDMASDVFKTILEAQKNYIDTTYTLNYETNNITEFYNLMKTVSVIYLKTSNVIAIPNIFVQEYYKEEQPMYLNYANIGTVYAKILVEALLENAQDLWSNDTMQILKDEYSCLGLNEKFFVDQISINLAYNAYITWTKDNTKEPKLIGLPQTPAQLLWISSASKTCVDFLDDTETDIFLHNRNFANDFKCSDVLINFNNCDGL
ncbi:hypothetical protein FQR65_LT06863 [Abscondita terminalis]|nr:hypothetical protein FQR65_LT06863 [Abscondita terminalis]